MTPNGTQNHTDLNRRFHDYLQTSLPRSVYDNHLAVANLVAVGPDRFALHVYERSMEWVRAGLMTTVSQAAAEAAGLVAIPPVEVCLLADDGGENGDAGETAVLPNGGGGDFVYRQSRLPGFPPPVSNWTRTPDFYFDVVLPQSTPTCGVFVGHVIRNTLGRIDKRGKPADWWCGVSYSLLVDKLNAARASVAAAVYEARSNGWVKRRARRRSFDYAIRWDDEPPDLPVDK